MVEYNAGPLAFREKGGRKTGRGIIFIGPRALINAPVLPLKNRRNARFELVCDR